MHTPAELKYKMTERNEIGERNWRNFANGTPNWSKKKLALVHTFERINRYFEVFHVKMAIYEFELEK